MNKIVREQVEEIEVDGEDYAIALKNLKEKYGNDKDIETIVRMCNQWQDSFHKAESRYNRLVAEVTKFQIKADAIIDNWYIYIYNSKVNPNDSVSGNLTPFIPSPKCKGFLTDYLYTEKNIAG